MKHIYSQILILVCSLCAACTGDMQHGQTVQNNTQVTKDAYQQWEEQHKEALQQDVVIGKVRFMLKYVPLSARNTQPQDTNTGRIEQYLLSIISTDKEKSLQEELSPEQKEYVQYKLYQDFHIYSLSDTSQCLQATSNIGPDLAKQLDILLLFKVNNPQQERVIEYQDNLLNAGKITFRFNAAEINNTPIVVE